MPPVPIASTPTILTGLSVSISFDHDAPSGSHSPSSSAHQSSSIHHGVCKQAFFEVNPFATTKHEPFVNVFDPDLNSKASSSGVIMITAPNQSTQPREHLQNDRSNPLDNIIMNPPDRIHSNSLLQILVLLYSVLSQSRTINFNQLFLKTAGFKPWQDETQEFDRLDIWN
ncbi:hypothetical protein Tco_0827840 [Tanacetum coccineum]